MINDEGQQDHKNSEEDGYIKTAAHNYVSRKSVIHGARNVEMKGKSVILPGCHIRGDFGTVRIGRYCHIGSGTIIRPPSAQIGISGPGKVASAQIKFLPLIIGNHTRIGESCMIESASIGSSVYIGNNCIISKRVIIKDCCYVEDGTVIALDTVIPPFSRVSGQPGQIVGDALPESAAVELVDASVDAYTGFVKDEINDLAN